MEPVNSIDPLVLIVEPNPIPEAKIIFSNVAYP